MIPVSVIIPCYRCAGVLERAVASVAAQTALPEEVIIVDDFSNDGTLQLVERLIKTHADGWLKVIALDTNRGPAAARNAGWELASRKYLAFLDADDAWHPRKLEIQYAFMEANPQVALCGHRCAWLHRGNDREAPGFFPAATIKTVALAPRRLLVANPFSTPTVMLKRDLPFRFAAEKRYAEDYLLWMEIAFSGAPVARIELPLASLFKAPYGAGGLSGRLWLMEQGVQDAFDRLHDQGAIGTILWRAAKAFSMLKYVRRRCFPA